MLKGFIYNGKSTESVILSSRLFLATFDTLDSHQELPEKV